MSKQFAMAQTIGETYDRYVSPEKLQLMKQIFDAVCEESAIPVDAVVLRDVLAKQFFDADHTSFGHAITFEQSVAKRFLKTCEDFIGQTIRAGGNQADARQVKLICVGNIEQSRVDRWHRHEDRTSSA